MPTTELEIFEVEIPNADGTLGTTMVGLVIDESTGNPTIELLNLEENTGPSVVDNIFKIAPAIRDKYFPDTSVENINWKMTSNYHRVGFSFQEIDGVLARTDFHDGIPVSKSFMSAEDFRASLQAPEGFDAHYSAHFGGDVGNAGGPVSKR